MAKPTSRKSKMVKRVGTLALFMAAAPTLISAQQECIPITKTTACGPWGQGYSFNKTALSTVYSKQVDTVEAFDEVMKTFTWSSSDISRQHFRETFKCPKWDGSGLRYTTTYNCLYGIFTASGGCNANVPKKGLCKKTCSDFIGSMATVFKNGDFCEQGDGVKSERDAKITTYQEGCMITDDNTCATFNEDDGKSCGFGTRAKEVDIAVSFCKANSNETCCNPQNFKVSAPAESKGLSAGAIIGIVLGVLAGIAALFFLALLFRRRRAKKQDEGIHYGYNYTYNENKSNKRESTGGKRPISMTPPPPAMKDNRMSQARMSMLAASQGAKGNGNTNSMYSLTGIALTGNEKGRVISMTPSGYASGVPVSTAAPLAASTAMAGAASTVSKKPTAGSGAEKTYQVIYSYEPQLEDELRVTVGDIVIVKNMFSDGWCQAYNKTSDALGALPVACLDMTNDDRKL